MTEVSIIVIFMLEGFLEFSHFSYGALVSSNDDRLLKSVTCLADCLESQLFVGLCHVGWIEGGSCIDEALTSIM